jgi:hypothetical protein
MSPTLKIIVILDRHISLQQPVSTDVDIKSDTNYWFIIMHTFTFNLSIQFYSKRSSLHNSQFYTRYAVSMTTDWYLPQHLPETKDKLLIKYWSGVHLAVVVKRKHMNVIHS